MNIAGVITKISHQQM